jgi:hypothetical protein
MHEYMHDYGGASGGLAGTYKFKKFKNPERQNSRKRRSA